MYLVTIFTCGESLKIESVIPYDVRSVPVPTSALAESRRKHFLLLASVSAPRSSVSSRGSKLASEQICGCKPILLVYLALTIAVKTYDLPLTHTHTTFDCGGESRYYPAAVAPFAFDDTFTVTCRTSHFISSLFNFRRLFRFYTLPYGPTQEKRENPKECSPLEIAGAGGMPLGITLEMIEELQG